MIMIPCSRILGDFLLSFSNWIFVCVAFTKILKTFCEVF